MENYSFVDDDSYTHAIILNKAMPILKIPKENVIGLAFEPFIELNLNMEFIEYAKKYIGEYYIGIKNIGEYYNTQYILPSPFVEHYSYMWHEWKKNTKILYLKTEIMSIIVSLREDYPGHIYRKELVKKILESDMNIHIYGNGSKQFIDNKNRIKGSFLENEPPYKNYKFTIAIENTLSNDYISEKYTNPIMFNTLPIYYGAKNIEKYFGKDWGFRLTGNLEEDFTLIKYIYQNNDKFYNSYDKNKTKDILINGYCYFPNLIKRKFL